MKHHKYLIGLIVLAAALVIAGVFAFKYMRTYDHIERGYPADTINAESENEILPTVDTIEQNDEQQEVIIQSGTPKQNGKCVGTGSACSSSTPCCKASTCYNGYCQSKV